VEKICCEFCEDKFFIPANLDLHVKRKHQSATKNQHSEAIKNSQNRRCGVYFKSEEQTKEHFEHAHSCKFCSSIFSSKNYYHKHLRKFHLEKKCNFTLCIFYTASKEEMEKHLKEKHISKKYKRSDCVYCGKSFANPSSFVSHVRLMHSEIAIRCDHHKCCLFFKTREDLEKHKKEGHKKVERERKSVACQFCAKTFADRCSYAAHIKRSHSEAIRCKYHNCCTFFKSEEELLKHLELKHAENYCCDHCEYKTSKRHTMINHLQHHHFPRKFQCPSCPKMFGNKTLLTQHFENSHKPQKCPHCHETGSNLHRHLVTTNCPECSQPFPCKKLLYNHRNKCKKVHECRECGKIFKIEYYLKLHVNVKHKSGQKWKGYKCKFCGVYFLDVKSLKTHLKKDHFKLLKYKCEFCEKAFLTRESYRLHIIGVHKIGGFECEICGRRFLTKRLLSLHLQEKHFHKPKPSFQIVECADCGSIMKKCNFATHFITKHF